MTALLPEWLTSCHDAITLLGEAGSLPTSQTIDLTDAALRNVVQTRDSMIEHLRAEPGARHADLWRAALAQVNVTLSELAGIEYPGDLNREHIELSMTLLRNLTAESEPRVRSQMGPLHITAGVSGAIQGGLAAEAVHRIDTSSERLPETERLP